MKSHLRPQCAGCPWRNMDTMRKEFADVVKHSEQSPGGFICHERCGPCDGPYHAVKMKRLPTARQLEKAR